MTNARAELDPCADRLFEPFSDDPGFRKAMGLPAAYLAPELEQPFADHFQRLAATGQTEALAARVENPKVPAAERLRAGLMLGLAGDPRIDPLRPAMVRVPATRATIGTPFEEVAAIADELSAVKVEPAWLLKECPRHEVDLPAFAIGRYPVTNGEYLAFLKATEHPFLPDTWYLGRYPWWASNAPVHGVSAADADAYAAWLTTATGRRFRLPREAEWELAAAGPGGRAYPWGDQFLPDRANTLEARIMMPTPVGAFPLGVSPYGCLDMAGNVAEFTADDYAPYPGGEFVDDDLAKLLGRYRIVRGGSFCRFRDMARCQRRHGPRPSPLYVTGFRLAEDLLPASDG